MIDLQVVLIIIIHIIYHFRLLQQPQEQSDQLVNMADETSEVGAQEKETENQKGCCSDLHHTLL